MLFTSGVFNGCFDRSHLGNIFFWWGGQDRIETKRCRCFATTTTTYNNAIPLKRDGESGKPSGSWSNFRFDPAAANERGKGPFLPIFHPSLYHSGTAYIFVLFFLVFLLDIGRAS